MCGIIGYVGRQQARGFLLQGLDLLSYRGYDSAGVALLDGGRIGRVKRVGAPSELAQHVALPGTTGIGHTRWATHGPPTEANAHPHSDCSGAIAIVHNGIFENADEIRAALAKDGHVFQSQTDSEVLAHVVENVYVGDIVAALREALSRVRGSYAIALLAAAHPGTLVLARNRSPLVVGLMDDGVLCASDVAALAPHTDRVAFLQDGEICVLSESGARLFDADGKEAVLHFERLEAAAVVSSRGEFEHHMLSEIHEMPQAALRFLDALPLSRPLRLGARVEANDLASFERIRIVACGTSYHAGLVARDLLERLSGLPVDVSVASEERYAPGLGRERTLGVYVSQSGETADTLEAMRRARRAGQVGVALVNRVPSTLSREADGTLALHAGAESSVAATKSFTNTLLGITRLGLEIGVERAVVSEAEAAAWKMRLSMVPTAVSRVLARKDELRATAELHLADAEHAFFLGRAAGHGLALEGALKLKEIAYVHAEGYSAGELKHGPLALVSEGVPVVAFVVPDGTREVLLSNLNEVKARGARLVTIAAQGDAAASAIAAESFELPPIDPMLYPIPAAAAAHLLAYYAAKKRGCPIDRPRNLAKSVTVE